MKIHKIGIIMNGVTGRMGTNQHLARSISAIIKQGGIKVGNDLIIMPDPILTGRREYALKEYGPVAKRVLSEWGINECIDFGHIVFNLVNEGLLGKTDEDSIEDFSGGYDFTEAFLHPFRPQGTAACSLGVGSN